MIEGNDIGTNAAGTAAVANGLGIEVWTPYNTIGGTTAGSGNVISGNGSDGVYIVQSAAVDNLVEGNLFGTNATDTAAVANSIDGLVVESSNDTIGGTVAGARNVISGNAVNGIYVYAGYESILIEGNSIGTNAAGTAALGNGEEGIDSHGTNVTIGGTATGAGNVISGNGDDGIYLGSDSLATLVEGNMVGTNVTGETSLPNLDWGVSDHGRNTTIGGTTAAAANVISANANGGIYMPASGESATRRRKLYRHTSRWHRCPG